VTIPLLMPTVMFLSIMGFIGAFSGLPVGLYDDRRRSGRFHPRDRVLLWQVSFDRVEMGYGSAIAVVIFAAVLALTLVQWRFFRHRVEALA